MIKLHDTVSFVDHAGQAHTGTVDAFRGQGMADLTLTDGVQVRQPVSSLTAARSNPRVNIRSNPRRLVRKNPQGQGSDVDLQKLLRTIGVQAGKSDQQIGRLFAQDPITEQEARALTQLLKDLIHALGVDLRNKKYAALTVRMRQLPVLPSNQRDELSEKIEAALQERTELDAEKIHIVKTRDQLLATLERANELQALQASIPKTLASIQEQIDALTRTAPLNVAAQVEVSKQIAQYEDRRAELQRQLSAVPAEIKALPPDLQLSSPWRKAWFNNQNKPSMARQEAIEKRINLLDATMEVAKKKLLEMPEWMRFFSEEAYEAELKKLDDEVAQAQLDLSQKLGPTIAERQNRKAQPAQFVQGLPMPSLPMAAELAQLLVQMGKTPAEIQDTLNGQNRDLREYALRWFANEGVRGLKQVVARAEAAENADLKKLNADLLKSDSGSPQGTGKVGTGQRTAGRAEGGQC
jgi:hypothetical protein